MQPFRVSYGDFPLLSNSLKGIHKVGRRLEGCSCSQAFTSVKISGPYTLGMQCKFERRLDGFYYINNSSGIRGYQQSEPCHRSRMENV